MMKITAEPMIWWSKESMTFIESNQKHLDHQQVHNMNRLREAMEEILEDEAVEEAMDLAVAMDKLPAITVEV